MPRGAGLVVALLFLIRQSGAQDLSLQPTCAALCISARAPLVGCLLTDIACLCDPIARVQILYGDNCISKACGYQDVTSGFIIPVARPYAGT